MKAFQIIEFGIDKLSLTDVEMPSPAARQVLVRMTAASLNFRDLMVVKGNYNPKMPRPMVPLSDGAGVVEEVGPDVTRWKKGDRVAGIFMQTWLNGPLTKDHGQSARGGSINGVLAEYVLFDDDGLVATPSTLSDEEAATLPCAGVTAWHALFEHTPAPSGATVLLQGTGGVSIFALQLAHAAGLRTIITSSSDEKLQRAKEFGADEIINYRTVAAWDKQARHLTAGVGVDHIVEVGGSNTLNQSVKAVRAAGAISVIGVLSGAETAFDLRGVLMNSIRLQGIYVGSRAMFERLNRAVEFHAIHPVIDRVFAWTEYPAALRHMETASHFGKIVLRF